jgi:hypothetical protein
MGPSPALHRSVSQLSEGVVYLGLNEDAFQLDDDMIVGACIKVQSAWRGFATRKKTHSAIAEFSVAYRRRMVEFLDIIVDEVLREDMIPDLLIEVIQGNPKQFEMKPEEERAEHNWVDRLIAEVVEDIGRRLITDMVAGFVRNYLLEKRSGALDPMEIVMLEIVGEVVDPLARSVCKDAVGSMVDLYMFNERTQEWIDEFLVDELKPIVEDVADDGLLEVELDSIIFELIAPEVEVFSYIVADETLKEEKGLVAAGREELDSYAITAMSSKLIESSILKLLTQTLVNRGEPIVMKEYVERIFAASAAEILADQYFQVEKLSTRVSENMVVSYYHEEFSFDIAIDFLLARLIPALDDDEAVIHDYEKGIEKLIVVQQRKDELEKAQNQAKLEAAREIHRGKGAHALRGKR